MAIKLHDSLTRETRELHPAQPDGVFRFYNCGPTVYAAAHIGNFRTFVVNDLLRRLLELEFPGKVKHVRNLTDVDDKTIRRSREEHRPLGEVTKQWTDKFHADCAALNCLPPHVEPAATTHIPEQIDMISILEKRGYAYSVHGSVYFKVEAFKEYGKLSRIHERELSTDTWVRGAEDADEYTRETKADFALWKAYKPEDGDNFWPSPWGQGRPGWHIECSAMSKKHLGDTIDLHTGGVDLLFPHHENEIAQSQCCNGTTFANHWYHSEHLLVDGKKMSKSLGNLYTLDDLKAKGFSPMALRYALLSGHPRKQLNFTLDSLHAAESALKKLRGFASHVMLQAGVTASVFNSQEFISGGDNESETAFTAVIDCLKDDLNSPSALGSLFSAIDITGHDLGSLAKEHCRQFARVVFALGLDLTEVAAPKADIPADIAALAEKRWATKQAKDFAAADALRKELTSAGWSMLDRKDGYSLEPVKK